MGKNTGKHIVNMIKTRRGEHPLFRAFGMGGDVDEPTRITRSGIQAEVVRWYPAARVDSIRVDSASVSGEFAYTIEVSGT